MLLLNLFLKLHRHRHSGGSNFATFDPKSLPADWRVFSSVHAIVMGAADWDMLSPGVREAMRTWIGFGGIVRIASLSTADAERVVRELVPADTGLGLFANSAPVRAIASAEINQEVIRLMGSRELVFAVGVPAAEMGRASRSRRSYNLNVNQRPNEKFPLRDAFGRRGVPYLVICLLLIVFAVLVGPVSLKLWAGPGKRHRLFFTTPLLSITTSGLLLLLMLFQDGLGIDGRRFVILDLPAADSSQAGALIYQEQFSRAGMTGGGGFSLEDGLLPMAAANFAGGSLEVRDGRAEGSWFSSRRDRSMVLAGSVPVRWKVTHEGASEDSLALRIESPITSFEEAWFVDADGLVWKWDNVAPDADGRIEFVAASRDVGVLRSMVQRSSEGLGNFCACA